MASSDSNDPLLRELARAPDAAPGSAPRVAFGEGGVSIECAVRLAPGELLAERFEVRGVLGRGGMGEVYRAHDRRLGREVAIKVLGRGGTAHQQRLEREARAASAIRHPHVLAVHDTGIHEGAPYLVLELVEGGSLRGRIAGGPLALDEALRCAREVALGLGAAHAVGVVHRDLKPENVLFTDGGAVKIADFGLAKLTGPGRPEEASLTDEGVIVGTTAYMAPEQARGELVDHRADLFALGAILLESITARSPFARGSAAETLSAVLRDAPDLTGVPSGVAAIVARCLEKSPAARFQSAADLAFALAQQQPRGELPPPAVRPAAARSDSARVGALAAAALLAVALLVVVALATRRANRPAASPPAAVATFERLTFRRGLVQAARFAADGRTIVHSASWEDGPAELFVTEPGLYEARPLGVRGELVSASASGQLLVHTSIERRSAWGFFRIGGLSRVPLHGGAPRELAEGVSDADLATDGTVALVRVAGDRWSLEWPAGTPRYSSTGWIGQPRLSPDGRRLAFVMHPLPEDDGGLVMVLDGGGAARAVSRRFLSLQGLAWSPSGERLLFTAADTGAARTLRSVSSRGEDAAGGERQHYAAPGTLRLLDIAPDGRLLLSRDDNRVRMVALDPDGTQRDLSWLDGTAVQGFSGDDTKVCFTESWDAAGPDYGVYLRPYSGGPAVRVAEGGTAEPSPTRDELLVSRSAADGSRSLWRVPSGAGDPRRVDLGDLQLGWMRWFPDGDRILVVALDGELAVVDGHGPPSRLGVRTADVFHVAVAPDGRRVAFLDGERAALLDLAGGRPRPLAGAEAGEAPLSFDRTSTGLYVTRAGGLPARVVRVDLASGARQPRAIAPTDVAGVNSIVRVSIAHDDRRVVFSYLQTLSTLFQASPLAVR